MPRRTKSVPKYRHHKASGQAVVTLNGRDIYLGPFQSEQSKDAYDRLISEWLANNRRVCTEPSIGWSNGARGDEFTVNELFLAYWNFVQGYYVKNGQPSGEVEPIRQAMNPLTRLMNSSASVVMWRTCRFTSVLSSGCACTGQPKNLHVRAGHNPFAFPQAVIGRAASSTRRRLDARLELGRRRGRLNLLQVQ